MGSSRFCDCCGKMPDHGQRIVRFSLRFQTPVSVQTECRTTGGGGIDLCLRCWVRIAKPRQALSRRTQPFTIESLFEL